jgi:cyclophilin family peptidyl-prolyl cis-trans isomerase
MTRGWVLLFLLAMVGPPPSAAQDPADTLFAGDSAAVADTAATEAEVVLPRVAVSVSVYDDAGKATELGRMVIELFPEDAPRHVENFLDLVKKDYYTGSAFHRIVPGFIVQGGDPISKSDWRSPQVGTGGPDYTLPAEIQRKHVRGAVAMARQEDSVNPEKESGGSQFYICLADLPGLDGGDTVFGQVIEGMDVLDKIARVKNAGTRSNNRALQRVAMTELKQLQ